MTTATTKKIKKRFSIFNQYGLDLIMNNIEKSIGGQKTKYLNGVLSIRNKTLPTTLIMADAKINSLGILTFRTYNESDVNSNKTNIRKFVAMITKIRFMSDL